MKTLEGKKVLIIGDVMVDEYLTGDAERISPEAPVPVVRVTDDAHVIGGAGNVASNIQQLGGAPTLLCVTGTGSGAELLDALLCKGNIEHRFIRVPGRKTTVKTRIMASRQQMLRIDREDATPVSGEARTALMEQVAERLSDFDVIVVSDYGKGVVTAELLHELSMLCKSASHGPRILVDPKSPNFSLYQNVFMLTPNAKETSEGAGLPVTTQEEILAAGRELFTRIGCTTLLTTLGARGMALFQGPDDVVRIPTMAQEVFDVTGAGDTVIGTAALALAAGHTLLDACLLANYAAGIVVGRVGASVVTPSELVQAIQQIPVPQLERWA